MCDVTRILSEIEAGDTQASEQLLPLVYDELRKLAAQRLAKEPSGQTLQATALVHEAFVRLVDVERQQQWNSRGHFFAAAGEAMRRILVERARKKESLKGGGAFVRKKLMEADIVAPERSEDMLALDEALTSLAGSHPDAAKLVELRYFAGLTMEQVAEVLDTSKRSLDRLWAYTRAWLLQEIHGDS